MKTHDRIGERNVEETPETPETKTGGAARAEADERVNAAPTLRKVILAVFLIGGFLLGQLFNFRDKWPAFQVVEVPSIDDSKFARLEHRTEIVEQTLESYQAHMQEQAKLLKTMDDNLHLVANELKDMQTSQGQLLEEFTAYTDDNNHEFLRLVERVYKLETPPAPAEDEKAEDKKIKILRPWTWGRK